MKKTSPASHLRIFTIGHSTRSLEDLVSMLQAHGVEQVVDVRKIPRSRHNPQFNRERLSTQLPSYGIRYRHQAALGGLRRPRQDSPNTGWRNRSFRGFADYAGTAAFQRALKSLRTIAARRPTAILCAEALPWRCHRSLIADALSVQGSEVRHILSASKAYRQRRTPFARLRAGTLVYPAPNRRRSI